MQKWIDGWLVDGWMSKQQLRITHTENAKSLVACLNLSRLAVAAGDDGENVDAADWWAAKLRAGPESRPDESPPNGWAIDCGRVIAECYAAVVVVVVVVVVDA